MDIDKIVLDTLSLLEFLAFIFFADSKEQEDKIKIAEIAILKNVALFELELIDILGCRNELHISL